MDKQQITICGCGWLGLALAKSLVQQGFNVYGTKQSHIDAQALATVGIQGLPLVLPVDENQLDTQQQAALQQAFATDLLVINVPPGRYPNSAEDFKRKIQSLSHIAKQAGAKKVLFISTTGVYADCQGEITEDTPTAPNTESGHAHVWLENWLREEWQDNLVVLRLSGLMGPDRHPAKHIVKRYESTGQPLENGLTPVNLIHQHDIITAIHSLINRWPSQKVLHLAAHSHPSREEYYQAMAKQIGLPAPLFVKNGEDNKRINAQQSVECLDITLKYPDLLALSPYQ
ncbi:MAG TPA: protein yeeZ precursor [Vibrio sp.]|uniref:NAD-dependent epimerase/dehydratase family protein n=1 Tax=Vibrio TaxID=662 RepID=UPI000EDF4FD1|nr:MULTISPECIES: NAD-dependent epimerase/dehydratase family protein [Vibrio]HCH01440.1 protein yeeZ precursor [Vibrio sp.]